MFLARRLSPLLLVVGVFLVLSSAPAAAQQVTTIDVGDTWFCNSSFQGGVCETTISAGDTIAFDFSGASLSHSATDCGADCSNPTGSPAWDTEIVSDQTNPEGFPVVIDAFDQPGSYPYYCQVHGASLMQGVIIVQAAGQQQQPTATSPAPGATAPTATAPLPVSGVPATGAGPGDGASSDGWSWWLVGALAVTGAALAGLGSTLARLGRPR